uniref:Uncharacterized protein n=1 Tax=Oryza punctata TaxID=4537 RepID=A0A0E0LXK8_ORYPU
MAYAIVENFMISNVVELSRPVDISSMKKHLARPTSISPASRKHLEESNFPANAFNKVVFPEPGKGTSNSPGPNDKPTINADAIIFTAAVVIDATVQAAGALARVKARLPVGVHGLSNSWFSG